MRLTGACSSIANFSRRGPRSSPASLAILLAGLWAIAPMIFLFFANHLSWKSVEGLQLGNIFNVFFNRDTGQIVYHEYFACGWLLVMIVLNGKWFLRQARNFRPLEKVGNPPAEADVPPVITATKLKTTNIQHKTLLCSNHATKKRDAPHPRASPEGENEEGPFQDAPGVRSSLRDLAVGR